MWRELFPKILKWVISIFFLILGMSFLAMVENSGNPGPLILAVFSFGVVYWLYKSVNEIPKQVALTTLAILLITAGCAYFVVINSFPFNMGFYTAWSAWAIMLGVPIITLTYWKYS